MLCQRARPADIAQLAAGEYIFDLKVDGIRCVATIEDWVVHLTSRSGEEITPKFPEVEEALLEIFGNASRGGRYVLDGEIACLDERGLPDWPATHKRQALNYRHALRAQSTMPAVFFVFDILEAEEDLRIRPLWYRRELLDSWLETVGTVRAVLHARDGEAMWGLVEEHQLEGLVAKRLVSVYREGPSQDWLKIKRTSTVTCLVGGHDPGTGSRAPTFGALHLYLLDESHQLVPVGSVGSGFSDRELRHIRGLLEQGDPFIVEIEYLDVTPEGQLRQPVFTRVRADVDVLACTTTQLTYKEVTE